MAELIDFARKRRELKRRRETGGRGGGLFSFDLELKSKEADPAKKAALISMLETSERLLQGMSLDMETFRLSERYALPFLARPFQAGVYSVFYLDAVLETEVYRLLARGMLDGDGRLSSEYFLFRLVNYPENRHVWQHWIGERWLDFGRDLFSLEEIVSGYLKD